MKKAENGDKVKVHYTGTLEDGSVFDSSLKREPLAFTVGAGQMIKGFNDAVEGMGKGDTKTFKIPSADAYGEKNDTLVLTVPKDQFPPNVTPEVGLPMSIRQQDGSMMEVVITALGEENITLDANHPLAGKDLTFEIEIMDVVSG